MQDAVSQTDKEMGDRFNAASNTTVSEMEMLGLAIAEILQAGNPVSNKAIIAKLIHWLELESDPAMLDIYRQLLERVVHKTPDDLTV
ncbi:biofilm/acid-resistance regulator YmgB/AriR [Pantoea sp. RRHST58]|uniref:biofilm/acid-resistance regulator YmgB/AriR n=1 Tax=Pantoea sp. RRHST58 TaxID=3425183 RepID=UPI0028821FC8|nr:biofilm/acid-resistance regulator YmgB/AriR [Enterobacter sp. BRE11]